ncbi:hypothetical protein [Candidatus Palauibacter soopunensis]|uniref:hypothetical protein n=1 Tax=Candidatus Palauibacter soopunensis TaxID=3056739 RepID=UPI0023A297CA|nr:hypothetical protein [Candidatus Palauibacter soopunensis]MDE2878083.1 hypothetical protein [Candidatus Palauibacter soopunensis]
MFRNRRSLARPSRRIALAGALFCGLTSAGCIFVGDSESRDEAEEVREDLRDAADDIAASITDAVEEIGEHMTDLAEELSAGALVDNPIHFREFYDVLPERAGDLRRTSREGATGGAFGFRVSAAEAEYEGRNGAEVEVAIFDIGALPVIGSEGFVEWLDLSVDQESDRGWERTIEYEGYPAIEEFRRTRGDRGRAEFTWFIEDRFVVELEGRNLTIDELHALRDAIDTGALADMRDREGG